MCKWNQLAEVIPEDQREELAEVLLEALASATWAEVRIEVRDHHLHEAWMAKSTRFRQPRMTKVTCTA